MSNPTKGGKRPHEVAGGANQPQHLVGAYDENNHTSSSRDGLPTGAGTSPTGDVADPHPSNEEHYDKERRPGGAETPHTPEPNDAIHDGKADKRPPPRPGAPA